MRERENCLMKAMKGTLPTDVQGFVDELKRNGLSCGSAAQDRQDVIAFLNLHRAAIIEKQSADGRAGYLWR